MWPETIAMALDVICKEQKLPNGDNPARHVIAERMIALAHRGGRSPAVWRDRVLREANIEQR